MSHGPKTAALIAYADDLLSERGRARLERHLAGCATCRKELASILLYERMAREARTTEAPRVDYARLERTLAEEAERMSRALVRARRGRWAARTVLALAAAGLLALAASWPSPEPELGATTLGLERRDEPPPPAETPTPESASLAPVVTLAAGQVSSVEVDGTERPLRVGSPLLEGDRLRSGAESLLHLRLSRGTGLVLAAESEVELARIRVDAVELALREGRIDQVVAPLTDGSRYVVRAAGYQVEVRGTRFSVELAEGVVAVELAEGGVEVETPAGEQVALRAPARWRSDEGTVDGAPSVHSAREAGGEEAGWSLSRLAHPRIARWEIDDVAVRAGDVELRMRPGEHEVRGWDPGGRLHTARLVVGAEPVVLDSSELRPQATRARPGHLEPFQIDAVLQRGRRQLAACYERSLRRAPEVQGRVRLRVSVDAVGDVRRVLVTGADPNTNAELRECIAVHAQRWSFPPPGGPLTFEVPLAFSARAL